MNAVFFGRLYVLQFWPGVPWGNSISQSNFTIEFHNRISQTKLLGFGSVECIQQCDHIQILLHRKHFDRKAGDECLASDWILGDQGLSLCVVLPQRSDWVPSWRRTDDGWLQLDRAFWKAFKFPRKGRSSRVYKIEEGRIPLLFVVSSNSLSILIHCTTHHEASPGTKF